MQNKKAFYLKKDQRFEIRNDEIGQLPTEYHVKVKTKWVGICGSDLNALEEMANYDFLDEILLGHEWVGEVVEVGPSVKKLNKGDHVTSCVEITCGHCSKCLADEGCENQYYLTAGHGMFCEYAHFPEGGLVKLPPAANLNTTLFEILSVAENVWMQMKEDFRSRENEGILIMGAGLLGISMALVLKRENINFTVIETIPSRIKRLQELGVKCVHLSEVLLNPSSKSAFGCIVDATGNHLNSAGGWKYLDHFGRKNFLGIILGKYISSIDFKTHQFFSKNATLKWIQGCTKESLEAAISSWSEEIDNLGEKLITHTFSLDEIEEAFAAAKNRSESARVVVTI